jgi:hypothetical protein
MPRLVFVVERIQVSTTVAADSPTTAVALGIHNISLHLLDASPPVWFSSCFNDPCVSTFTQSNSGQTIHPMLIKSPAMLRFALFSPCTNFSNFLPAVNSAEQRYQRNQVKSNLLVTLSSATPFLQHADIVPFVDSGSIDYFAAPAVPNIGSQLSSASYLSTRLWHLNCESILDHLELCGFARVGTLDLLEIFLLTAVFVNYLCFFSFALLGFFHITFELIHQVREQNFG